MVNIELITIGDEILIGQIVDTNSAWIGQELSKYGFRLVRITSVPDGAQEIINAIDGAFSRADVALLTGGIGPTKDDITKRTLCDYFHTDLVFDETVLRNIEDLFATRPNVLNALTRSQAFVPRTCTVIQNKRGTAPVTWFEHQGKILVSMPGVPEEMTYAMTHEILPRLCRRFRTPTILHKTVLVTGYPESLLAMTIADWENALPTFIKLAYLPSPGLVKLRLTGTADDKNFLQQEINRQIELLRYILGDAIVAEEDMPMEQIVGKLLKKKNLSLSTAESCTGGNIARLITSVPGSSEYYKGSVVAYCNEVKKNLLGVSPADLEQHGAVSREVVEQMAKGVLQLAGSDVSVSVSGIAGPDGGTVEKPVGTVWIAVCTKDKIISREHHFGIFRDRNIAMATHAAFVMIKEILI